MPLSLALLSTIIVLAAVAGCLTRQVVAGKNSYPAPYQLRGKLLEDAIKRAHRAG